VSGGEGLHERHESGAEVSPLRAARSPVLGIWLWSRAAIWAAALLALYTFQPNRNPLADRWDDPKLTHDLGALTDVWARWDSVWFLRIVENGYALPPHTDAAFFPLYPAVIAGLSSVLAGHDVLAGLLVSLAASLGAFFLLHRLAEERLGVQGARRAVLYLAVFPMSLFLIAVYSESLFLLLALATFVLAERGRWLPAWATAGLAILTRIAGVALLPALLLMAWRAPTRRRALAGIIIPIALFAGYPAYLAAKTGTAWSFVSAQGHWQRHLSYAGPFGGIWDGVRAGWAGIEQFVSGSNTHNYWPAVSIHDSTPMRTAAINLSTLAFLGLFIYLAGIAWRRFGATYGIYCLASLAIPLSVPSSRWPLWSMPRFGLAIFPIFLALAVVGDRPRAHTAILAVSGLLLGIAISQWALWQWVS
jgi:hypothetical protein